MPSYLKKFFGQQIIKIEAGSYYSMAINGDQELYTWGEARMGQLGLGSKNRCVTEPTKVQFKTNTIKM